MLTKPDKNKPAFKMFPKFWELIEKDRCPMCESKINEADFRNELSKKEFSVSGMCQSCQNKTFNEDF